MAYISIPPYKGKNVKIFYATQYRTEPPGFALFTNRPEGIKENSLRYIESKLRDTFGFQSTPIKIRVRGRKQE
jgi:GTP-binding protein